MWDGISRARVGWNRVHVDRLVEWLERGAWDKVSVIKRHASRAAGTRARGIRLVERLERGRKGWD